MFPLQISNKKIITTNKIIQVQVTDMLILKINYYKVYNKKNLQRIDGKIKDMELCRKDFRMMKGLKMK
jgi:hypothetical protein